MADVGAISKVLQEPNGDVGDVLSLGEKRIGFSQLAHHLVGRALRRFTAIVSSALSGHQASHSRWTAFGGSPAPCLAV